MSQETRKLEGKVAVVTGGNSGIGLATAKLMARHGAKVIITARSKETYEKANAELGNEFTVIQTDVSKVDQISRFYDQVKSNFGGIDILFANAGVALFRPTAESDEDFFDNQFDTNVKGLFFTVTKALPLIRPGGTVVLNSSVVNMKGSPGASVYAATKAAVRSFARTWTAEIPVEHIRFNVISPGPIATPIFDKLDLPAEEIKAFSKTMENVVPIKRFGTPEEMANVVLFLASSDSSYIAGADIYADGGFGQV